MAARIPTVLTTTPRVTIPTAPIVQAPPEKTAIDPRHDWKTPDVHYWSRDMMGLVSSEYPSLPAETSALDARFDNAASEIAAMYPDVKHVLDKMTRRRACIDHDLGGVKPTGLLAKVWFGYVRRINAPECYALFRDTMMDMGGTCVQGDTHRLFTILVALHRDGSLDSL